MPFSISYTPPLRRNNKLADLIYDDDSRSRSRKPGDRQIKVFERMLWTISKTALSDILRLRRMRSYRFADGSGRSHLQDELVNYLSFAVTGHLAPLNVPPCAMYLDAWLGGQELYAGDTPKDGPHFIAAVAIEGFPAESYPEHPRPSGDAWPSRSAFPRASSRSMLMKPWRSCAPTGANGSNGPGAFSPRCSRPQGGVVNEDAAMMAREAEDAITDASSNLVAFGYLHARPDLDGREPGDASWTRPASSAASFGAWALPAASRRSIRSKPFWARLPATPSPMSAGRCSIASISRT